MTLNRVPDEIFDRVREHYSEGEIVEIAAMAGIFNYLNRMSQTFQVEPTQPGEGMD